MDTSFENLNMTNLRDVFCEIFFGDEEQKKYVVPLQGNWYNPKRDYNADTWIGYVIDTIESDVQVVRDAEVQTRYLRTCKARIHLMFVGVEAENFAQSVMFWTSRQDVKDLLDSKYKGQLNNKNFTLYTSTFQQTGANDTLCWNVGIEMTYNMLLDASDKPPLTDVTLAGNLIIGGQ